MRDLLAVVGVLMVDVFIVVATRPHAPARPPLPSVVAEVVAKPPEMKAIPRAPPPPAPVIIDDARPVAHWAHGEVTVGEVREALDTLPRWFTFASGFDRKTLVDAIAQRKQLVALAKTRGFQGANELELIRKLLPKIPKAGDSQHLSAHQEAFKTLLGTLEPTTDYDGALVNGLQPGPDAWKWVASPRPRAFDAIVANTPFHADLRENGTLIFFDEASSVSDGPFLRFLLPNELLYLELVSGTEGPLFSTTTWVPVTPPTVLNSANTAYTGPLMPPSVGTDELSSRYQLQLQRVTPDAPVNEADARLAFERVQQALRLCLARHGWEHRWSEANVTIVTNLNAGVMNAAMELKMVSELARPNVPHSALLTMPPELCGLSFARWRFPSNVDGRVTYELKLTGKPWTDEEQAARRQ